MMELDITELWVDLAPMDYSASVAELGANAGRDTWLHACEDSKDFFILDNEEKREAFRAFVQCSGGWSADEIRAWSDLELNALCIQWIAGDVREAFPKHRTTETIGPDEWAEYERNENLAHSLFLGTDNRIYFYIGS